METLITILIIFVIIEFLEARWQKSDNLNQVLLKNYALYKQYGLPSYLLANISFFYTLAIVFSLNNFTFWINMIVVLKFIDISMKLYLFQKIDKDGKDAILNFFPENLSMQSGFIYINTITYSLSMLFALFL